MKVGPIVVGAAIGGLVWVLALRTANAATRDDKPEQGGTPPPSPDGFVRDAQGNVVSTAPGDIYKAPPARVPPTSIDSPPIISPPAGTEIIAIAQSATDVTVTGFRTDGDAAVGNTSVAPSSSQPMRVDPGSKTIEPDPVSPIGGQGTDQAPAVANAMNPAPAPPSYAASSGNSQYIDYMVARFGPNWQSLTPHQINMGLMEAAEIAGLPL